MFAQAVVEVVNGGGLRSSVSRRWSTGSVGIHDVGLLWWTTDSRCTESDTQSCEADSFKKRF